MSTCGLRDGATTCVDALYVQELLATMASDCLKYDHTTNTVSQGIFVQVRWHAGTVATSEQILATRRAGHDAPLACPEWAFGATSVHPAQLPAAIPATIAATLAAATLSVQARILPDCKASRSPHHGAIPYFHDAY